MNAETNNLYLNPPASCEPVTRLWDWSQNFNFPSPATLFLDLIGYSEDTLGERLCVDKLPSLGYLEIGMLGEALTAYSDHPAEVYDYVTALIESEREE